MAKGKSLQKCARCEGLATYRTRFYGKVGLYEVLHCAKHALPNSQPLSGGVLEQEEQTGSELQS